MQRGEPSGAMSWWQDALIYQVYLRSFQDSNDDGVGDLAGLISRLDYLQWLGAGAIWLSPITVSPDADYGYDVSDYRNVQPVFGTLADADGLIAEAGRRGIRVLLDIVPNHTSDRHPWFHDPSKRDWYVWTEKPNNWVSHFGGPAWTFDRERGLYYLHNFLPEQPDLNWWNPEVRQEFESILRFWFDRGVAGFRVDDSHGLIKDRQLRDNPPAGPADHPLVRRVGQRYVYNENRPEVHEILRGWRLVAQEYEPERLLMGETFVLDVNEMAAFYGRGDELQLSLNFPFLFTPFVPEAMSAMVAESEAALAASDGWPAWCGSNHDAPRFPTRWAAGDPDLARCALLMLLTLRGTPVLYQGDEIGMTDVPIPPDRYRDRAGPGRRDPARTPMQWEPGPGAGFTAPGVEPWLPVGNPEAHNVAEQREDPESMLWLCRDLGAARRRLRGRYEELVAPAGAWAYARGESGFVALNLGEEPVVVEGVDGTVEVGTQRQRQGERVSGRVTLAPREGVLLLA